MNSNSPRGVEINSSFACSVIYGSVQLHVSVLTAACLWRQVSPSSDSLTYHLTAEARSEKVSSGFVLLYPPPAESVPRVSGIGRALAV